MKASLVFIALLSAALSAPNPCPYCSHRQAHSLFTPKIYSEPAVYARSAPVYTQTASVVHHEAPVYAEHHSVPVVEDTFVHTPDPVIRTPTVIGSYTTQTIGTPEYIPVKTTIQKTSQQRIHYKVPVEYNYEVVQPVQHTQEIISNVPSYRPVTTTHVVSAPSSTIYSSAPVSSSFASAPVSTSYVSSPSFVSSPISNTIVSAPATTLYKTPSTYYSKSYSSSHSNQHYNENYGTW